jgi:hypothetical protein
MSQKAGKPLHSISSVYLPILRPVKSRNGEVVTRFIGCGARLAHAQQPRRLRADRCTADAGFKFMQDTEASTVGILLHCYSFSVHHHVVSGGSGATTCPAQRPAHRYRLHLLDEATKMPRTPRSRSARPYAGGPPVLTLALWLVTRCGCWHFAHAPFAFRRQPAIIGGRS